MDRAGGGGERRPVVGMLLLPLRLLLVGLSVPLSLRLRLSIRERLSLSGGTGGGVAKPSTAAARHGATAKCAGSTHAAAACAAVAAGRLAGRLQADALPASEYRPPAAAGQRVSGLEGTQKGHQILLLLRRQLGAEDQVEELDRVFQCQKTLVVHVGRVVLGAAQSEGFDRPVP